MSLIMKNTCIQKKNETDAEFTTDVPSIKSHTAGPTHNIGNFNYDTQLVHYQSNYQVARESSQSPASDSNYTGLPDNLKHGLESLSGFTMDDVKVHYNSSRPKQLNAHAYAQGSDIHIASGNEHYLPHEAWHVVQQKQGKVRPSIQLKGIKVNDEATLEHEADVMGKKALHYSGSSKNLIMRDMLNQDLSYQLASRTHRVTKKPRYSNYARKDIIRNRYKPWRRPETRLLKGKAAKKFIEFFRAQQRKKQEDDGDMLNLITDEVIDTLHELGRIMPELSNQMQFQALLEEIQEAFPVAILNYKSTDSGVLVTFNINPTYQVLLSGGQRIGMQMLGTDTSNTNRTKVQWKPAQLSFNRPGRPKFTARVGWQMHADPISQDHQKGMIAGKNTDQDTMMKNLAKVMGSKKTKYIKGHLLNDHLGGPAIADNLFPITDAANAKHLQWMEKYVKADIDKGFVCQYRVVIDPQPDTINPAWQLTGGGRDGYTINSTIRCEFSRLNMAGNPITASTHKVNIPSIYNKNLSGSYDPGKVSALTINNRYGSVNEGSTNPPASSIGATYNEATYHLPSGYSQSSMHTATMGSATYGGSFGWMGSFNPNVNVRTLNQTQIKAVVRVSTTAVNIYNWLLANPGPMPLASLRAVRGVGPATMKKMRDAKWAIL